MNIADNIFSCYYFEEIHHIFIPFYFCAGSRDGTIAIWSIPNDIGRCRSPPLKYSNISPTVIMSDIELVDKIRDIVYNDTSRVSVLNIPFKYC